MKITLLEPKIMIECTLDEALELLPKLGVTNHIVQDLPVATQPTQTMPDTPRRSRPRAQDGNNRRNQVFQVMTSLAEQGKQQVRIREIVEAHQRDFPGEDSKNLDQVVRDLLKINRIIRVKRGAYQISNS